MAMIILSELIRGRAVANQTIQDFKSLTVKSTGGIFLFSRI